MSESIRCEACRWWRHEYCINTGVCELNPARYIDGDPSDVLSWFQPRTLRHEGCSRGEPKTTPLTVSDGVQVAMVDGLPVFLAKKTEEQP